MYHGLQQGYGSLSIPKGDITKSTHVFGLDCIMQACEQQSVGDAGEH